MCLAMPTPPENRFTGKAPGPALLFLGGIAFLLVLLVARIAAWRQGQVSSHP